MFVRYDILLKCIFEAKGYRGSPDICTMYGENSIIKGANQNFFKNKKNSSQGSNAIHRAWKMYSKIERLGG